jgi:hypothetical protein
MQQTRYEFRRDDRNGDQQHRRRMRGDGVERLSSPLS